MRKFMLSSVAVLALATAPALAANDMTSGQSGVNDAAADNEAALECQQNVDQMIDERREMISADGSRAIRQDLRTLREAAFTFARNGDAEACEMVMDEMADLIDRRSEMREEAAAGTTAAGTAAETTTGAVSEPAEADPEVLRKEAVETYNNSPQVAQLQHALAASDIIDAEVVGINDESLGSVSDVILAADGQSVSYVLISHGGFLGMGDKLIPVSMKSLRVVDTDDLTFLLPVTEEELSKAPSVEREDEGFPEISSWGADVEQWWNRNISS